MNTLLIQTEPSINEARALRTIVSAFATDPAVRWMYPGERQYSTWFPQFVQALGGRSFECGGAHCSPDGDGAALWLPPDVQPNEAALERVLEHSLDESRLPEVFDLLEQMSQAHPEGLHWYLPFVGVRPDMQRHGRGTALLLRGLDRCDSEGLPAYLESTNPRNVWFYERLGFRPLGRLQTRTSPPIVPMLREPQ